VKSLEVSKLDLELRQESLLEREFKVPNRGRFGMEKSACVKEIGKLSRMAVCV